MELRSDPRPPRRLRSSLRLPAPPDPRRRQPHHPAFDQDSWAERYPALAQAANLAEESLATFLALRRWNLLLIQTALPTFANKPASHPERGEMTFQTIVETMAGHDLNHLLQLRVKIPRELR